MNNMEDKDLNQIIHRIYAFSYASQNKPTYQLHRKDFKYTIWSSQNTLTHILMLQHSLSSGQKTATFLIEAIL